MHLRFFIQIFPISHQYFLLFDAINFYTMHTRFYNTYITYILYYIYIIYIYITHNLKAYNKMRRATDIISLSLSERKSTFNTSPQLKLSNVTGCFTACIGVHSPAAELENVIQFRLQYGPLYRVSGTYGTAPNSPAVLVIASFKTCQGLECQHVPSTLIETMGLL